MIGIYSFGKKQYTPAKKQVGMTDKFWGEHIFIEKNVSSKEEIKNGKVVIEVFDYNVLSKNSLVGKKLAAKIFIHSEFLWVCISLQALGREGERGLIKI